jgi:polyketide biosynthesis acyl carrier protein
MSGDDILHALALAVIEVCPDIDLTRLSSESSLHQLGLNSMERAEVIMSTLSVLKVRMPMTAFAHARNLGALAALIEASIDAT